MIPHKLTIINILLLALSLNGMAQSREVKLELKPTGPKAEPVKIERINNQDILRIASLTDTIRICLTDDCRAYIKDLMLSIVGSELTLKDIEGVDVKLVRVTKNMKPGIYFRNKKSKSVSVFNDDLELIKKRHIDD